MSPRRVLVLGASGMIGRAVLAAGRAQPQLKWVPASHRDLPGHLRVDYESLTTAEGWAELLQRERIDAVVNCVGLWQGSAETFERVQYTVPVALFTACEASGVRVVHVSALGFSTESPLPYAATKARADRFLLANCPSGVVVYPSLVFGSAGPSSQFFLNLAALPVQVDFGFEANLQPVHVDDVARDVVAAVAAAQPPRSIVCAGTHAIAVPEYFDALRRGMGLGRPWLRLRLPRWCARGLFAAGERLGSRFVNHQTWVLLQAGTRSDRPHPEARPYERFACVEDRRRLRRTGLYWLARGGMATVAVAAGAALYVAMAGSR